MYMTFGPDFSGLCRKEPRARRQLMYRKTDFIEVFSPPRISLEADKAGLRLPLI